LTGVDDALPETTDRKTPMSATAGAGNIPKRSLGFARSLWIGTLLLNLFVIGMVTVVTFENRTRTVAAAAVLTENYSRILEESLVGFIAKIDIALQSITDEIGRQRAHGGIDGKALDAFLARQEGRIPEALGLRVTDAQGIVRHAVGGVSIRNANIADRDHFIRVRDDANAGLVISEPLMGRTSTRYIVVFARRVNAPDGSFAGEAHFSVAVDSISAIFSRLDLGPRGSISLWNKEQLVARYSRLDADNSSVGVSAPSPQLHALVDAGKRSATYHARSVVDGVVRTYHFQQVGHYPLYVQAGLADDDYLAQWRSDSLRLFSLAALFVVASFAFAGLAHAGWIRHERMQDVLRESEARFRDTFENAPIGMVIGSIDNRILRTNRVIRDLLGYGEGELEKLSMEDISHADDVRPSLDLQRRALAGGSDVYMLEKRYLRKDGQPVWVQTTASLVRGADGTPRHRIVQVEDIGERKRIYEALQNSEERLREAQRIAQLGSWELDLLERSGTCSDEVLDIFELATGRASFSFDTLLAVIHPDDREWVRQSFLESVRNRRPLDLVHRLLTADGVVKYWHERGESVYGEDGTPLRTVGTVQDVTFEKLNEEALRESEERFRTVADFNFDWEYWVGPDSEFIYLSPSCERITGYSQAEFISDRDLMRRIVHPQDRQLVADHLADYRAEAGCALDFRIIRKDGGVRWIAHGCRPVFGKDGRFMGRRVSNRDITERKQAEGELLEAKERLALALDASQLSIWDMDVAAGTVKLDGQGNTMMGLPPETVTTTVRELARNAHVADVQKLAKAALATFRGTTPAFREEFRFKAGEGTWKWIVCSGKVVARNAAGRAVRAIGTNLDITERKAAEEQIRHLAFYDALTELPNRRLLMDRLGQALSQARRFGRSLAVMFLDLDNFKQINDSLGHDVGDALLRAMAVRLAGCMRMGDTVARQGGDEFVIVLAEIAQPADASVVADKILTTLAAPATIAGHELSVTTSIGIAVHPVDGGEGPLDLMKKADIAMYQAKQAGRNRYRFFGADGGASS
jgi:diguanylate cyclase (GGDEF)-like protein/PAS domain S-box-containing protein